MAVDLLQAIHRRWAADPSLLTLLPAEQLSTGLSPDKAVPRAVVIKESDRPLAACNDGSAVGLAGVRIEVFHTNHDAAAAVVERIKAVFDRSDFPLAGSDRVINMRHTNDSEQQQDDGLWRLVVDFECLVHRAAS